MTESSRVVKSPGGGLDGRDFYVFHATEEGGALTFESAHDTFAEAEAHAMRLADDALLDSRVLTLYVLEHKCAFYSRIYNRVS